MRILQLESIDAPCIMERWWIKNTFGWTVFSRIPYRFECCRELHQYLRLKSKILNSTLCSCRVSVLFSFSASFFKLQVKFPRSLLECHQLSSTAADLEPDTRCGISLPRVSVRQPDSEGPWAEGGVHTAPCRRSTRRPPTVSAPCLKELHPRVSPHAPTYSTTWFKQ